MQTFSYLGVQIDETLNNNTDVKNAVGRAKAAFWKHRVLLRNNLLLRIKLKMLKSLVFPILRYGSECFALTKLIRTKITSFDLWCYRRIFKICWTEKVSNEEVVRRIRLQNAMLLDSIIKRKASFFGHIARGSAGDDLKGVLADSWRKIGRVRRGTSWWDAIEEVTNSKDVRANMVMGAQDKNEWLKMCRARFPNLGDQRSLAVMV